MGFVSDLGLPSFAAIRPQLFFPIMFPRGAPLGWLGYPGLAFPELCFFRGFISGHQEKPPIYLVDGVAINGVSGGPAFDLSGLIVGLISAYRPNESRSPRYNVTWSDDRHSLESSSSVDARAARCAGKISRSGVTPSWMGLSQLHNA
jgi:hypothetical protein